MRVLAIDPSLRGTGFAVLEGRPLIRQRTGAHRRPCPPRRPRPARASMVRSKTRLICSLVHAWWPSTTGWRKSSTSTNRIVARSRESFSCRATAPLSPSARPVARQFSPPPSGALPIFEYSPREVKQAVVGRGGAEKTQVAFMVRALLGLTETPAPDAADALAIGLTHLREQASPLRKVTALARI